MRFSERYGYKEPAPILELDEITDPLRNCIWNMLSETCFHDIVSTTYALKYSSSFHNLSKYLRHFYFKTTIDERSGDPKAELREIKDHYFDLQFPKFYDFLEIMVSPQVVGIYKDQSGFGADDITKRCNQVFEEEKAAVRFVENLITPITNEEEREAISQAAKNDVAGSHISQAIKLYRDRSNPDYRNSVKESISAVEATYRRLTGEGHKDIGTAIVALKGRGINLPKSLKKGFSSIYGWTNGSDGIRHALMDNAREVTESEARLMLVMCSAYVNYLLSLRGSKPSD